MLRHRRSQRGLVGHAPPKFLAYIVILCFERRYTVYKFGGSKMFDFRRITSNKVKSTFCPSPKIFWPSPKFWAGYATVSRIYVLFLHRIVSLLSQRCSLQVSNVSWLWLEQAIFWPKNLKFWLYNLQILTLFWPMNFLLGLQLKRGIQSIC